MQPELLEPSDQQLTPQYAIPLMDTLYQVVNAQEQHAELQLRKLNTKLMEEKDVAGLMLLTLEREQVSLLVVLQSLRLLENTLLLPAQLDTHLSTVTVFKINAELLKLKLPTEPKEERNVAG